MKKIVLVILLMSGLISCKRKSFEDKLTKHELPKQLVDDKTIYEFLNHNSIINDSAFKHCDNIVDRKLFPYLDAEDSLIILKMKTIFTKEDADFIFKQAEYAYYFKLKEDKLHTKKIIKVDTIQGYSNNSEVRGNYWDKILAQNGPICSIRMPLFSIDKKTVFIKTSYNCGMLCGEGGTYIYRKVGKKWIKLKTLNTWVS